MSETFIRRAISPLFGIATLLIGLASVALFSFSIQHETEPAPSFPITQIETSHEPATPSEKQEVHRISGPKITQSAIVRFPHHGAVRVESVEQVGRFPQIVFTDLKNHAVVFRSAITDSDGWLKPTDEEFTKPFLRFREVRSAGFPSPLIMAVAVTPGGSDDGFSLAVYGEIDGKFARLTDKTIDTDIQGGYYLGFLNKELGYGLVSWEFIWDDAHYAPHRYFMTIYRLQGGKFRKVLSVRSRRKYDPYHSSEPLR
jgi:hypothetical protein